MKLLYKTFVIDKAVFFANYDKASFFILVIVLSCINDIKPNCPLCMTFSMSDIWYFGRWLHVYDNKIKASVNSLSL